MPPVMSWVTMSRKRAVSLCSKRKSMLLPEAKIVTLVRKPAFRVWTELIDRTGGHLDILVGTHERGA